MVFLGVLAISFDVGLYHSILYHRGTVTDGLAVVQSGAQGNRVIRSCQLFNLGLPTSVVFNYTVASLGSEFAHRS